LIDLNSFTVLATGTTNSGATLATLRGPQMNLEASITSSQLAVGSRVDLLGVRFT
jgi:hypothetical protein